eukprot:704178-Amphidinium_carterae.1
MLGHGAPVDWAGQTTSAPTAQKSDAPDQPGRRVYPKMQTESRAHNVNDSAIALCCKTSVSG